jgi:rRNA-processing protein FCF1
MKVEGKLQFIIFKQVLNELEAKRRREPRATKFIRLLDSGLLYIENNKTNNNIEFIDEIKNDNESTDNFLLRKSIDLKNEGYSIYIATNDSELRKKAKSLKINTIFLRQKKFLSIEQV